MPTLLVGYDLNRPTQKYAPLIEALKGCAAWWHHLDSTWLVKTELTPTQFRGLMVDLTDADGAPVLDENDEVLVIDVTGRARAWRGFNEKGSKWLNETFE